VPGRLSYLAVASGTLFATLSGSSIASAAMWEEGFAALTRFKQREGHCRVPAKHKEDGFELGTWVGRQRGNDDGLSEERRQKSDEIGFNWGAPLPPTTDG